MNRIEFMAKLETLLKDVSAEERQEAIQYYNDYFDDAGVENEAHVMKELGTPVKLAATIKAGLKGQDDDSSEFRETGYTDTRFEEREAPAKRGETYEENNKSSQFQGGTGYQPNYKNDTKKRDVWKIIAIILLVLLVSPIVLPIGFGLLAGVIGLIIGIFGLFFGIIAGMIGLVIAGIALVVGGIVHMFSMPSAGIAMAGAGLISVAIGLVGTALAVKLCIVIFPIMFRFIIDVCRKPFHKKEAGV